MNNMATKSFKLKTHLEAHKDKILDLLKQEVDKLLSNRVILAERVKYKYENFVDVLTKELLDKKKEEIRKALQEHFEQEFTSNKVTLLSLIDKNKPVLSEDGKRKLVALYKEEYSNQLRELIELGAKMDATRHLMSCMEEAGIDTGYMSFDKSKVDEDFFESIGEELASKLKRNDL